MFERKDVIIVASVSCIYGLGPVETYSKMIIDLRINDEISRDVLVKKLVSLQYKRNNISFNRGNIRVQGDIIEIFPAHLEDRSWKVEFFGDIIEGIYEIDPITGKKLLI